MCEEPLFPASTDIDFLDLEHIHQLRLEQLTIHTRFRGHPEFDPVDHQSLFRHDLLCAVESGGSCASLSHRSELLAVCAVQPLDWDSRHFGLPMARLTLAASPACPPDRLPILARETINGTRGTSETLHLSVEIDIDDYPCVNALLSLGANILDIKREYRWTSLRDFNPPKFLSLIREYQPEDKRDVLQVLDAAHFESRFSRDPLLDPCKVRDLYRIWLEKLLDGDTQQRIALVMERNGRIQACGAIEKADLSTAGVNVQIMNGGIYVASARAVGGYYPMIYSLVKRASSSCATSQTCVSLNNHAATRVLERMNLGTPSTRYAMRLSL